MLEAMHAVLSDLDDVPRLTRLIQGTREQRSFTSLFRTLFVSCVPHFNRQKCYREMQYQQNILF